METSHQIHEHKIISQQEKLKKVLERTLEYQRLEKLKVVLKAKMEPTLYSQGLRGAMTKYYAIECKGCETPIVLGAYNEKKPAASVKVVPAEAVPCRECGGSYTYGTDDLFSFPANGKLKN